MPEIARFLGIIITMFYKDHAPPHLHAYYGEYEVVIAIEDGRVLEGKFPRRQLKALRKWCTLHQRELLENWALARQRSPLKRIEEL